MTSTRKTDLLLLLGLLGWAGVCVSLSVLAGTTLTVLNDQRPFDFRVTTLAAWLGFIVLPMLILAPVAAAIADSSARRATMLGLVGAMGVMAMNVLKSKDMPLLSILGIFSAAASVYLVCLGTTLAERLDVSRLSRTIYYCVLVAMTFAAIIAGLLSCDQSIETSGKQMLLALVGPLLSCLIPAVIPAKRDRQSLFANFARGLRALTEYRYSLITWFGQGWLTFCIAGSFLFICNLQTFLDPSEELVRGTHLREAHAQAKNAAINLGIALVAGAMLGVLQRHPFRVGMMIPLGMVLASIGGFLGWTSHSWGTNLLLIGVGLGAASSAHTVQYRTWSNHLPTGIAVGCSLFARALGLGTAILLIANLSGDLSTLQFILLIALLIMTVSSLIFFLRAFLEGFAEFCIYPMYRVRLKCSPELHLPLRGPALIVANHAAWFDPLWVAKVVPFAITPMMTSSFYDLPVIRWLMKVVGTIRVPEVGFRKEAPELQEAIAALERGDCVVIFPEGYLRRKEEVPLRRFARGVWTILAARPQTPVYAFWVEGGWGSYFSHRGGPPTRYKKFDWLRRIDIGAIPSVIVDAEILKDHLKTRYFLMEKVNEARMQLGLPRLEIPLPASGEEE